MRKIQANTFWIFAGTIAFIVLFLFAVIKIYQLTLTEAKKSHQMQQMEMAKAVSIGINTYLDHLIEDMQFFALFPEVQNLDEKQLGSVVDKLFNHYNREAVKSILVTNKSADIIYKRGDNLPNWIAPQIKKQLDWVNNSENGRSCWFSQVQTNIKNDIKNGLSFIMLVPIINNWKNDDNIKSTKKLIGSVGYIIDFNLLMQQYIAPLKLGQGDFAWVIDGNGRLIYHPSHSEMLFRSIKNPSQNCLSCHPSFKLQNKMLISQASIEEYKIGDEPKKILAYVPLQLNNEKWVLVISTFLPQVTANLRENFRLFFLLGVVILAAIITFGLSLYYVNAKRIRAEEAQHQFEQMQQLQQQLNHASKLASIGEIVDTVAHEINTPAGIISAQADAMRLQMDSGDKIPEEIQVIKEQTRRISKYTRSLLGYSKRVPYNPELIKLNDILDESIYLLGHRFRAKKVTAIKNIPFDLPLLLLDRGQIEQVFINLLNNAVDAIEGSGEIRVDVRIINKKPTIEKKNSVEGIEVNFADNGKGISATDISQIFDPFFSTKPPSEGTGLGLYISKAIIQRHRGRIEVKSTVGKGTTFRIFLPNNLKEN